MPKLTIDESKIEIKTERQVKVRDILIDVPLRYKCNAINAIFPISTKKAKEIIKTDKIKPLEIWPGKSLLCITLFDYYKSPVGPYKELCLSTVVGYKNKINIPLVSIFRDKLLDKMNFFVFKIAQNTEIAIEHGAVITGYPRYFKPIEINISKVDNSIFVQSREGEYEIIKIKIKEPKNEKISENFYKTYLIKDEKIYVINMRTYAIVGKSKIFEFSLGSHILSNYIENLEIKNKPIECIYYRDAFEILDYPRFIENI